MEEQQEYALTNKGKAMLDLRRTLEMAATAVVNVGDKKTLLQYLLTIRQACNRLEKTL